MSRKFVGRLSVFMLAGASLLSTAQEPMPTPGASTYLAGTAESFLASCRSDLDDAKKRIATVKASQPPRDAVATLQAFDTALLIAADAENRAGLAEQVHPAKPFRDAAQVCEQEVSRLLTDISLDKEMYNVLASLDGSRLDPAASYYLRTSLRDYHRSGVDQIRVGDDAFGQRRLCLPEQRFDQTGGKTIGYRAGRRLCRLAAGIIRVNRRGRMHTGSLMPCLQCHWNFRE